MRYNDMLPMAPVGTLDDLLERARRGVAASTALDAVKDKLTALRDDLYRKFLNAPDERAVEFKHALRAIERLAQALLVDEAQGELAYAQLLEISGLNESEPEVPFRPARVSTTRKRPRRASGQAAPNKPNPSTSSPGG